MTIEFPDRLELVLPADARVPSPTASGAPTDDEEGISILLEQIEIEFAGPSRQTSEMDATPSPTKTSPSGRESHTIPNLSLDHLAHLSVTPSSRSPPVPEWEAASFGGLAGLGTGAASVSTFRDGRPVLSRRESETLTLSEASLRVNEKSAVVDLAEMSRGLSDLGLTEESVLKEIVVGGVSRSSTVLDIL